MAGIALAEGVQSANTVGFIEQTIDPNSGTASIGVNFVPVGNSAGSFTVAGNAFGTALNDYDVFYAFDAEMWDLSSYTFISSAEGWSYTLADGTQAAVASLTIAPRTTLYYMGSASSFVLSGEVAASGTVSQTFNPENGFGFDFVNPFPVATTFADLETFANAYDVFYIFDPDLWDLSSYTFISSSEGWSYTLADGTSGAITDTSTVFLPAGKGATYCPGSTATWAKTLNY